MSRRDFVKNYGAIVLAAVGMIVGAGFFAAKAVASDAVRPLETRVSRIEEQQVAQDRRLDEIHAGVQEILRRTAK